MATEQEAALRELYHLGELEPERASALEELSALGEFDLYGDSKKKYKNVRNPTPSPSTQNVSPVTASAVSNQQDTTDNALDVAANYNQYIVEVMAGVRRPDESRFERLNEDAWRGIKQGYLSVASRSLDLASQMRGMFPMTAPEHPLVKQWSDAAHELSVQIPAVEDPNMLEQAYLTATQSMSLSVPMMLGGWAVGAPAGAAALFGLTEMARSYDEDIRAGLTKERAMAHSAISGVIEGGTEVIPFKFFGKIIDKTLGKTVGSRVAKYLGVELIGENIAEFTQRWNDTFTGLAPTPTKQELGNIALLTSLSTVMAGGAQGGLAVALGEVQGAYTAMRKNKDVTKALDEYTRVLHEIDKEIDEAETIDGLGGPITEEQAKDKLQPILQNIVERAKKDPELAKTLNLTDKIKNLAAPEEDVIEHGEVVRELDELVPEDTELVEPTEAQLAEQDLGDVTAPLAEKASPAAELKDSIRRQGESNPYNSNKGTHKNGMLRHNNSLVYNNTKKELQAMAVEMGVAKSGNKDDIAQRLYNKAIEEETYDSETTRTTQAQSVQDAGRLRGSDGLLAEPRGQAAGYANLEGLPTTFTIEGRGKVEFGAFAPARDAAQRYMDKAGLPYNPPRTYAPVDKGRATRIAQAFDQLEHNPRDPKVKAAYRAMIDETLAQYREILNTGLKVEFIDYQNQGDPYASNPRLAMLDVIENNHLYVFSTRDGFGTDEVFDPAENPLLELTEFKISGQQALANDIFRVVHDYFGHIKEGVGFRATGEENAWRSHSAMYSPLARQAMTTETRGQNSWVNYGPHGETNRTATSADTFYSDQKVGLMPSWVVEEGSGDPQVSNAQNDWMPFQANWHYRNQGGARTTRFNAPAQEHAASILNELPAVYVRMAEFIGFMEAGQTTIAAQYLKGSRTVRIREDDLYHERGPMFLAHEFGHAIDMWDGGEFGTSISRSSPLYDMRFNNDYYGPLMQEAIEAYYVGYKKIRKIENALGKKLGFGLERDAVRVYMSENRYGEKDMAYVEAAMELNYPFNYFFNSRTTLRERNAMVERGEAVGTLDRSIKPEPFFQAELFAQTYAMYHHMSGVLNTVMPQAAKVMEQIDESGQTSITRAEANSRLRKILRSPGSGVGAQEISEFRDDAPASAEREPTRQRVQGSRSEQRRNRRDLLPIGRKAFDALAHMFSRAAPLGALPSPEKYMTLRSITQGFVGRSDKLVERLSDVLQGLDEEVGYEVSQYLTTADSVPSDFIQRHNMTAKEHFDLMQKAKAIKRLIRNIGRELVKAGILEQEIYEKHKDEYLPRMYLKHILGEDSAQMLSSHGKMDLSFIKRRKDLPEWTKEILLGQVNDPSYLVPMTVGRTMRDLAVHDFLNKISKNKEWVAPASIMEWEIPGEVHQEDDVEAGVAAGDPVTMMVTPQWLVVEGERILNVLDNYPARLQKIAKETATLMVQTGKYELRAAKQTFNASDFVMMPDNPSYGALRGAWVRKEIADSVRGALSIELATGSWAEKLLGNDTLAKVQSTWKLNKVALNAPTVARNVMSNLMLLNLSGMPLFTPSKYNVLKMVFNDGIKEIVNEGKYYRIALRHGVNKSTFSSTELLKLNREYEKRQGFAGHNVVATAHALARKVSEIGGDIFQFTEMTGKIAKIKYEMEKNGLSEADAVIEANKWLFDYSLVPNTVEFLRKYPLGAPFLTFYYKVSARMAEVALTNPHRFLPYVALFYGAFHAALTGLDIDDEDLKKVKFALPEFLRDKMGVLPMPYRDDRGEIQFVDMSYIFPWSMPLGILQSAMNLDLKKMGAESGVISGPVVSLIAGLKTNTHPFYKKPIWNEGEPAHKQYGDMIKYAWNIWAPGTITFDRGNAFYKIKDSFWGESDAYGNLPPTKTQAFSRLFGINIYPVDQESDRARNITFMMRAIQDYIASKKSEMRKRPSEAAEIQREMQARVQQMTDDMQIYIEESQMEQ